MMIYATNPEAEDLIQWYKGELVEPILGQNGKYPLNTEGTYQKYEKTMNNLLKKFINDFLHSRANEDGK